MFDSLETSASALMAQRTRMDTIAGNVANLNTTRNENGELSLAGVGLRLKYRRVA